MTLPEHTVCSLLVAQFGARPKHGTRGVALVTVAGILPDVDAAAKLFGDEHFWRLHHALGHSLLSVAVIAIIVAGVGRVAFNIRPVGPLMVWCAVAAFVHCLTDSLYWWGVNPLWPVSDVEVCFNVLEYCDLIVFAIWFTAAWLLWKGWNSVRVASISLGVFFTYAVLRWLAPAPEGAFKLITGGWIYEAPWGTPVLDWW